MEQQRKQDLTPEKLEKLLEYYKLRDKMWNEVSTSKSKEEIFKVMKEQPDWYRRLGQLQKEIGTELAKEMGVDISLPDKERAALPELSEDEQKELKRIFKEYMEVMTSQKTTEEVRKTGIPLYDRIEELINKAKEKLGEEEFSRRLNNENEKTEKYTQKFFEEINADKEKIRKLEEEIKRLKEKTREQELGIAKGPKSMAELTKMFVNKGLGEGNFKGIFIEEDGEILYKWAIDEAILSFFVSERDIPKLLFGKKSSPDQKQLIPKPPSVSISQIRNIDTIITLIAEENKKREARGEPREARVEFYFKDYAKIRGYTDEEMARGGKFNEGFKRDLITGGVIKFKRQEDRIIMNAFYGIGIPDLKSKGKWEVGFNWPWDNEVLNLPKGYYPILTRALGDRRATDTEWLFLRVVLIYSKNYNPKSRADYSPLIRVKGLLNGITTGARVKERQQDAYKILAECITYVAENYKEALTEIRISRGKKYTPSVINDLGIFKRLNYKQFKAEILRGLGIDNITDALIGFYTTTLKEIEGPDQAKGGDKGKPIDVKFETD